jgi:hypothetical protein
VANSEGLLPPLRLWFYNSIHRKQLMREWNGAKLKERNEFYVIL